MQTVTLVRVAAPDAVIAQRYLGGAPYEFASAAGGTGTSIGAVGFMQCFRARRGETITHVSVSHESGTPGGQKIIEIITDGFDTVLAQTTIFVGQDNLIDGVPVVHQLDVPVSVVTDEYYWVGIRNINAAGGDDLRVHWSQHMDGLCKIAGGTQADIDFAPTASGNYNNVTVVDNQEYFPVLGMKADDQFSSGTDAPAYLRFGLYANSDVEYERLTSPPALTWTRMAPSPPNPAGDRDAYGWFVGHNGKLVRGTTSLSNNRSPYYEVYDPDTDSWTIHQDTTVIVANNGLLVQRGCKVGSQMWILGARPNGIVGYGQDYYQSITTLDLNTFSQGTYYDVGPLQSGVGAVVPLEGTPVVIGTNIYYLYDTYTPDGAGGNSGHAHTMWRFDTVTHVWTKLASLPAGQVEYTGLVTDGTDIYMPMGYYRGATRDQDDVNDDSGLMRRYVVAADKWEFLANIGPDRTLNDAQPVFFGGFVFYQGATDDRSIYDTAEVVAYEIATDRWYSLPELPITLSEGAGAVFGNRWWISGFESDEDPSPQHALFRSSLMA